MMSNRNETLAVDGFIDTRDERGEHVRSLQCLTVDSTLKLINIVKSL